MRDLKSTISTEGYYISEESGLLEIIGVSEGKSLKNFMEVELVATLVRECEVSQVKRENIKSPGLLRPLEIPNEPWRHIAMDFITELPKFRGVEVVWLVIDRLHGLPDSIVSDKDNMFLSEFWKTLSKICSTMLNLSSVYHPQSDKGIESSSAKMKNFDDSERTEKEFKVNDWIFMKFQPYRQIIVALRKNVKLSAKYFRPYEKVRTRPGTEDVPNLEEMFYGGWYFLKNSLLETVKEGDVREKLEGLQGNIERSKKLRADKGATTYSDQSQPKTTTNHHTPFDFPAKNHRHRS
ncbi:hypothetical protein AgCh_022300 [Apium graveolens]